MESHTAICTFVQVQVGRACIEMNIEMFEPTCTYVACTYIHVQSSLNNKKTTRTKVRQKNVCKHALIPSSAKVRVKLCMDIRYYVSMSKSQIVDVIKCRPSFGLFFLVTIIAFHHRY
jgi:hypothetical protein